MPPLLSSTSSPTTIAVSYRRSNINNMDVTNYNNKNAKQDDDDHHKWNAKVAEMMESLSYFDDLATYKYDDGNDVLLPKKPKKTTTPASRSSARRRRSKSKSPKPTRSSTTRSPPKPSSQETKRRRSKSPTKMVVVRDDDNDETHATVDTISTTTTSMKAINKTKTKKKKVSSSSSRSKSPKMTTTKKKTTPTTPTTTPKKNCDSRTSPSQHQHQKPQLSSSPTSPPRLSPRRELFKRSETVVPRDLALSLNNNLSLLTEEEEQVAQKYIKMLKMKIPKEAVRHKMKQEQVTSTDIYVAVFGDEYEDGEGDVDDDDTTKASLSMSLSVLSDNKKPSSAKAKKARNGFHWSRIPSQHEVLLRNSVWSQAATSSSNEDGDDNESDDISKHIDAFRSSSTTAAASAMATVDETTTTRAKPKHTPKFIDMNRANNVEISLRGITKITTTTGRTLSYEQLANCIDYLDPFEELPKSKIEFLKDVLPTSFELRTVSGYNQDRDGTLVVPAEVWFHHVIHHTKRIHAKVEILQIMETYNNTAHNLIRTFDHMINTCNSVMTNTKLPLLLDMVKQIGNKLNMDGGGKMVKGFKLEFLSKLSLTKGSDKKTTALDLLVAIFMDRNQRDVLELASLDDRTFSDDCIKVSKLSSISSLLNDVNILNGALNKCKKELKNLKQDILDEGEGDFTAQGSNQNKKKTVPVIKLPTTKNTSTTTRGDFLSELKSKTKEHAASAAVGNGSGRPEQDDETLFVSTNMTDDSSKASTTKYDLRSAMVKIARFLKDADMLYGNLVHKCDEAIQACIKLSEFFCETTPTTSKDTTETNDCDATPADSSSAAVPSAAADSAFGLLGILAEFASNLDVAVKKYDDKIAKENKKAKTRSKPQQQQQT